MMMDRPGRRVIVSAQISSNLGLTRSLSTWAAPPQRLSVHGREPSVAEGYYIEVMRTAIPP
jgi:hypothetical protein